VRTILVFAGMGALEAMLSALTPRVLDTLGNMYAFGASLGYLLVFISLIRLRYSDPYTPRPYTMPLNIGIKKKGVTVRIPLLGYVGAAGVSMILIAVVLTHSIGRIAGPAWIGICLCYYAWFRHKNGLPFFGSVKRDWETEQIAILTSAEEYELVETYKQALKERDERKAKLEKKNGLAGSRR
jgi:APA family basic amino acid/polyamine antiporter